MFLIAPHGAAEHLRLDKIAYSALCVDNLTFHAWESTLLPEIFEHVNLCWAEVAQPTETYSLVLNVIE